MEREDHTILMNRDTGMSSNLGLHLISLCTHTLFFHLLLFLSPLESLIHFVSFSFLPFCLLVHDSLSLLNLRIPWFFFLLFSPCLSNIPMYLSSASTPLDSCILVGVVGCLALSNAQSVSAALAHLSVCPAPCSLTCFYTSLLWLNPTNPVSEWLFLHHACMLTFWIIRA